MIKEVVKQENELVINSDRGSRAIKFSSKVRTILKFNDSIIVMLDYYKEYNDRNIFRVDENGNRIWQVSAPDPYNTPEMSSCFTYLGLDASGKIKAGSMNGFTYEVDLATGNLLNKKFTK